MANKYLINIQKRLKQIERNLGSDGMLSELLDYLDADTIADFVETIENTYDIDEEDYNDYDECIDHMNFQCGMTCG